MLELTRIFKALSDDTRLKIMLMLTEKSLCACKILEEFSITQPTLSYHMNFLEEAALVICTKKGIWNYYSINSNTISLIKEFIKNLG